MPLTRAEIAKREAVLTPQRSYSTLRELADIEPPAQGIKTGWTEIDKLILGLQPNRLNEFVGYTSHGKTSGMTTVVYNNLDDNRLMLYVSADDSKESLLWKFLSMKHNLTIDEVMERPKSWRQEYSEALEPNLVVHGDDHISVNDIGRIVDSMQDDYGKQVDLVCFDYLGVLTESGAGQAVTAGVLAFKRLVRLFPETVFVLGHQCNRGAVKDISGGLELHHVEFGGVKECDGVMIGFRRRVDTEDMRDEDYNHEQQVPTTNISVMKNKVLGKRSPIAGYRYAIDTTTSMLRPLTKAELHHNVISLDDIKLKRNSQSE
jgi:KaiC/GvpD/RAD55 family RecA-like ATPase